jgi:hypothetical protein
LLAVPLTVSIIGAPLGIPLGLLSVYFWWEAKKAEKRAERQAELVEQQLER